MFPDLLHFLISATLALLLCSTVKGCTDCMQLENQSPFLTNVNFDNNNDTNSTGFTAAEINRNREKPRSCKCQNGGVCIGGFLCSCPTDFNGRYCQKWTGNFSCGSLKHREIYYDFSGECSFCQCINGTFNCDNAYTCEDLHNLQQLSHGWNDAHDNADINVEKNLLSLIILSFPAVNKIFVN